jgi:hypothetical protein
MRLGLNRLPDTGPLEGHLAASPAMFVTRSVPPCMRRVHASSAVTSLIHTVVGPGTNAIPKAFVAALVLRSTPSPPTCVEPVAR